MIRSSAVRLLLYGKWYLLIAICLVVGVMAIADSLVGMQQARLDTLRLCTDASLELHKLQQKFINLIAYDWLKVLSLQNTTFDMTASNVMYN